MAGESYLGAVYWLDGPDPISLAALPQNSSAGGKDRGRHDSNYSLSVNSEPERIITSPPSPSKARSCGSLTPSKLVELNQRGQRAGVYAYGPKSEPIPGTNTKNSSTSPSIEVEPEWVTDEIKILFAATYRKHGLVQDRIKLNKLDVYNVLLKKKSALLPLQPYNARTACQIMNISDEKYEWLLKWNKKIAKEELLKGVDQQELASTESTESACSSVGGSSKGHSGPSKLLQGKSSK
ncbi:hypothetical protein GYMLUDRAFT_250691 [Collybiopsis luxurians FD-317 M1]|uniref:Uncharacterized protein n=1 Tax=Collybiopsis luxurians FD-317 M1 TaxID=944289 RepID=A0A0D0CDS8_9AGAR|nr:hypothetical protein GYMLUDRAFT_250691 [Collybiopsis luxurians FD-317 M1]